MSSKMLLSAMAVVATVAVVASPFQDPSFEYPASKYIGYDLPKSENAPVAQSGQTRQAGDHVSVTFKNATVREVLDWLKDQGVSFVVSDDEVDKDARISINSVNQPLEVVMQALARSWRGHWARNNDIWVFQKGADAFAPLVSGQPGDFYLPPASSGQKLTKEQQEEMRKAMEKLKDSKVWEQHAKEMEKWSQDFEKRMEGMKFEKMDPKAMEEFHKHLEGMKFEKMDPKAMEEFHKHLEGMKFEKMDPKAMEELQKHMMELRKDGKVFRYELKPGERGFMWDGQEMKPLTEKQIKEMTDRAMKMSKDAEKLWRSQDGKVRVMDEKAMKEFQEKMKKMGQDGSFYIAPGIRDKNGVYRLAPGQDLKLRGKDGVRFYSPQVGGSSFTSHNLKSIYESLTPAQEKTLETRGFLRYSDLNSNQRAMLGVIGEDTWTISYKAGKVNITIKSDR